MKKLIIFFGVSVWLVSASSVSASFSDVPKDSAYFDSIDFVQTEKIVQGYSDGTFRPDYFLNRAEFIKIVTSAVFSAEEIKSCTLEKNFTDISSAEWVYGYTCIAKNNGIIKGYGDNSFKPWQYISFIEAAKIIVSSFGFPVADDEIWYRSYVETLGNKRAIPMSIQGFSQNLRRGELAEIIFRLKTNLTTKLSKTYIDLEKSRVEVETRDWNIYYNKKYNYSLKYPENWYIGDKLVYPEVKDTNNFGIYLNPGNNPGLYLSIHVEINMSLEKNNLCFDLFGCVKRHNALRHPKTVSTILEQKNLNFAGERAILQKISRGKWTDQEIIIFKNGNLYVLNFTTSFDKYDEKKLDFQRIVATFKFEPSNVDITDWVTYRNEQLNIYFKQPGFASCCKEELVLKDKIDFVVAFSEDEKLAIADGFSVYLGSKKSDQTFNDYLNENYSFLSDKKPLLEINRKEASGIQIAWMRTLVDGQKIVFVSSDKTNRILVFAVKEKELGAFDARIREIIASARF